MKQTRAFLGIQSIITHWVTLRTMCRCPSSSRSGDGSAKGSLLIIGDSLATAWHSPTLSAGHQTGTETKQGGLRQFLTSPSIVRAYYCRSAVSVQDCTVVKYISKCLPGELAKDTFLGRANSWDHCGLLPTSGPHDYLTISQV